VRAPPPVQTHSRPIHFSPRIGFRKRKWTDSLAIAAAAHTIMRLLKTILLPLLALAQVALCAEDYYKVRLGSPPFTSSQVVSL
jgi:hypothetical protein